MKLLTRSRRFIDKADVQAARKEPQHKKTGRIYYPRVLRRKARSSDVKCPNETG